MNQYIDFLIAHWELSVLLIAALIWIILAEINERRANAWSVDSQQAVELINKKAAIIFDLRDALSFTQGYVSGSKRIDFNPATDDPKAIFKITPQATCLFICATGQASSKAVHLLRAQGYSAVYVLMGGICTWQKEHYPVITKG